MNSWKFEAENSWFTRVGWGFLYIVKEKNAFNLRYYIEEILRWREMYIRKDIEWQEKEEYLYE